MTIKVVYCKNYNSTSTRVKCYETCKTYNLTCKYY